MPTSILRRTLVGALATTLLLVLLPTAHAHEEGDAHGRVTVHDAEDAPPEGAVDGGVECLFWVQGHDLTHGHGTLVALSAGSFGVSTQELGEWEGTPAADGTYSFEAGPFNITEAGDRWEIIVSMRDEDGASHSTRSESFAYGPCGSDSDEVRGDEHGILAAHDARDGPATSEIECEFYVRGEGMSAGRGELFAFSDIGDPHSPADLGAWRGAANGDGTFSFLAGPFTLGASGEWSLQSEVGTGNWTEVLVIQYRDCESAPEDGAPSEPECPADVTVDATNDGNRLAWSYGDAEGTFRVHRDGVLVATLPADARDYLDHDVEAGTTYAYAVTFDTGSGASSGCMEVEATAVPLFGSPLVGALALLGGVGAFAWMRRRA